MYNVYRMQENSPILEYLPVPRGTTAEGGFLHFNRELVSSRQDNTHPTVPSPPQIRIRNISMSLNAYKLTKKSNRKYMIIHNYDNIIFKQ